jgi:AcrR family transcriptional regulator
VRALPGREERGTSGPLPWSRDEAALAQREKILRVTAEVIAKRGYAGTKTDTIVRRAHVGYGTFHRYFTNKEAAYTALFAETYDTHAARVAEAFGGPQDTRPWPDRVAAAIACFYVTIAEDPILWKACIVEVLTAGPKVLERNEEAIESLGQILRLGRKDKRAPKVLPKSLETTLAGGIVWIAYQRLVLGEAEKLPELLAEAVQFALVPYLGEAEAIKAAKRNADVALAQVA